jgi:hypothetical protein
MPSTSDESLPAGTLTTTYEKLSDFLFHEAHRGNDMDADGSGYMVLTTYSIDPNDDRDGIYLMLHFKIVEPVPGVTDIEDNGQDAAIVFLGADREASDHEWEEFSEEEISPDGIATYDDLLKLIQDNENPRGENPAE